MTSGNLYCNSWNKTSEIPKLFHESIRSKFSVKELRDSKERVVEDFLWVDVMQMFVVRILRQGFLFTVRLKTTGYDP